MNGTAFLAFLLLGGAVVFGAAAAVAFTEDELFLGLILGVIAVLLFAFGGAVAYA